MSSHQWSGEGATVRMPSHQTQDDLALEGLIPIRVSDAETSMGIIISGRIVNAPLHEAVLDTCLDTLSNRG